MDFKLSSYDAAFPCVQILPRLLNLQVNTLLQQNKVYLFTVKQKETLTLITLGLHVNHNKVCVIGAGLIYQ